VWSRSPSSATIVFASEADGPVLVIRGRVEAIALNSFAGAMEVVLKNHDLRFVIDVSGVDSWSLVAQAMVLATARRKAAQGEQLVLRGASQRLREQSQQLGVFEHVRSIDSLGPTWGTGDAAGGATAHAVRPAGGDR
jgi:anti-anti-sigma regulatory factor